MSYYATMSYCIYHCTTHTSLSMGSPSHGGVVAISVFGVNQLSLPTLFDSVLFSISVFMALSTVLHKFSQEVSAFSLCSSGLISALVVLSTILRKSPSALI